MKVSEHLQNTIAQRLAEKRIVVWYDAEQAFGDFARQFVAPSCRVIYAGSSRLRARREADEAFRDLNTMLRATDAARGNLLIYLPFARGRSDEERRRDPFEVFAVAGDTFGDDESERLQSLAHQAMPELAIQIERLFRESRPTLAMLDNLSVKGPVYPLLEQVLGTQSVVEIVIRLLGDGELRRKVEEMPGCGEELLRMLKTELGFQPAKIVVDWKQRWALLGRYVLFSEFAADLVDQLPPALANLPRAGEQQQQAILAIASGLRDRASYRESYLHLAQQVEQDLGLAHHFDEHTYLGKRDTFPFEEKLALKQLVQIGAENVKQAKEIIAGRAGSIWHEQPERAQRWRVAGRCLALLDAAEQVAGTTLTNGTPVSAMIGRYVATDGWCVLDQQQRLLEQSITECTSCEDLEPLIRLSRERYRKTIEDIQERFLRAVTESGWPSEGVLRQAQVFDRFVAPALERREKVAYVLADALRFEMGQALLGTLSELGEAAVVPVCGTLPAITPVGMAALLPGADGLLALQEEGETLIPYLGETRLRDINDRRKFLEERFGDRVVDIEIGEFLSILSPKARAARVKEADLVVMRDSRIDNMGENVPGYEARKYISNLLGDLRSAVTQLVRLGYRYVVIATDHGFVLLPDVEPGDTVKQPAGYGGWPLAKRRCLLGQQVQAGAGNRRFRAEHVGIQSDAPDFIVPSGFKLYTHGSGYFHEGLSLQECVLPVITLRAKGAPETQDETGVQFELRYRRETFTSQVIALQVSYRSLLNPHLRVRIEAFDGSGPEAVKVGEVAECEARDEVTHEVILSQGQEIQAPLLLEPDFHGKMVEIRATDAETGVVYDRLKLTRVTLD